MTTRIKKRRWILLALPLTIAGFLLVLAMPARADTVTLADSFTTEQPLILTSTQNSPEYSITDTLGSDILGGERDLKVEKTGADVGRFARVGVSEGELFYSQDDDAKGYIQVIWDGDDNDASTIAYALNVDLTTNNTDRFVLTLTTDNSGSNVTIIVYTDATHWSTITESNIGTVTEEDYTFFFSDFVAGTGATAAADFSDVGAIVLELDGRDVQALDASILNFEAQNPPTAVTLASFTAEWDNGQVLVTWETALEIDTVGFNLWRSTTPDGEYVRISETLILAASPGGVMGGSYSFVDSSANQGTTYYYKLEELEIGGVRNWYGPTQTNGGSTNAVTLTTVNVGDTGLGWWLVAAPLAVIIGTMILTRPRRPQQHS